MKKTVKLLSLSLALVMLVLVFASCSSVSIETYESRLEKAGYSASILDGENLAAANKEIAKSSKDFELKACLYATKGLSSMVIVYQFKSTSQAKSFMKEAGETLNLGSSDYIERSGDAIIIGTSSEAVNAALGK